MAVAKPDFLTKPPVELLKGTQLAASGILPRELLTPTSTASGADVFLLPRETATPVSPGEVEIPMSKLLRYMAGGDTNGTRVVLLRDLNGNTGTRQQFGLSPQAQRILNAHRLQRLTENMSTWNRRLEKGDGNK